MKLRLAVSQTVGLARMKGLGRIESQRRKWVSVGNGRTPRRSENGGRGQKFRSRRAEG